MKKRIFALLLTLVLVMTLLPAGAQAVENQLYWRDGQINSNVLSPDGNYFTSLSSQAGNSSVVALYTDNTSGTPIAGDTVLTYTPGSGGASGDVTAEYDNTLKGWIVRFNAVCSGTLSAVIGGTTYSLSVSAALPNVGFYSAASASEENFISSFPVTDSSKTFYLCADTGWTLTSVAQDNGSFANITVSGDKTYATITLNGSYSGEQSLNLVVAASGPSSQNWSGRYFNISLTDERKGLTFCNLNCANGVFSLPSSPYYQNSISLSPGYSSDIALYYKAGTYTPVTGTVTGPFTLTELNGGTGWYNVQATGFGSGSITYTVDSKTYSIALTTALPDVGFYSANSASQAKYISSFTVTDESKTFYLCANTGWTLTSVAQDNGSFATVSLDSSGKFATITLNDSYSGEQGLNLVVAASGPNSQNWSGRYFNISLTDERKGLTFCNLNCANGVFSLPSSPYYQNSISLSPGHSSDIALFYYDGSTYAPVTATLTGSSFTMTELGGGIGWYEVRAAGTGSGSITYTVGGSTYSIALNAALPGIGYFSSQNRSDSTLVTDYTFSGSGSNILWLMSEDGFTSAAADGITWRTLNGNALPDDYMTAEKVERGNTGVYDVKVTLLNYFGGNVGLRAKVPQGEGVYSADVNVTVPHGSAGTVTVAGEDYRVGLGNYDESGVNDNCYIDTGMGFFGPGGDVRNDETTAWKTFTFMQVLAASEVVEGGNMTSFHLNRTLTGQIQVNRVWIEPLTGDSKAMALSPTGAQELTGSIPDSITIYAKPGSYGYARVWANVTVGGKAFDVSSLGCFEKVEIKTYTRPENDTVAKLNTFLAGLVSDISAAPQEGQRTYFRVDLNHNNYDGTIDFPDNWPQFSSGVSVEIIGNGAAVTGGMDLTGVNLSAINDIQFKAKSVHQGKALYNGGINAIDGCSFTDYDVACDSSSADAALCVYSNCTFTNNNVGIVYDHGNVHANMSAGTSTGNSFLGNTTAIRIVSTNEILTPFELRFSNSNFIGNTTDVDVNCDDSSFYFYADYFGAGTSVSDCQYRIPFIDCTGATGSFVYTNPRRSAPYSSTETSVPPLVLDASLPVSILNSQAANLPIYDGSLAGETIKIIDDREKAVGTWSFEEEKS